MSNMEMEMNADPFDDVVEVEPVEEVEAEQESEEPKDEGDEISQDSEESKEDGEVSKEADEEEPAAEKSEESDESDKSEEQEDSDDEKSVVELSKQIEDGSLEVKIEDNNVSLKDLKNDYIGQKEISRRFTEYDVKSKQLEADTNEINGYIDEFAGRLKNGDSIGAMQYFGEFAGVAPYMIKEQLIAALRPEIIKRENMSETEVQNEYLHNQNTYLQEQRKSDDEQRVREQSTTELNNSINEIRKTNGIEEQEWKDTYSYLEKTLPAGSDLTPELVAQTVNYSRDYAQAESIVDLSGEKLENKDQWVEELVSVKEKYPDFTDEDLKEVLNSALATHKKSSVEQKLVKKLEKNAPSKKVNKKQVATEVDPELDDWL